MRNLLERICHEGMLSPVLEKKGILGDVDGRRPGDVTIPVWRANKGLAIDVAVTTPFGSHNLTCTEPCESYAESKKHAYYDKSFKGTAFDFAAMVFETTGAVNREGLEVLRQLFRFAAKHQGLQLSVCCGRAWGRLSYRLPFLSAFLIAQEVWQRLRRTQTITITLTFEALGPHYLFICPDVVVCGVRP